MSNKSLSSTVAVCRRNLNVENATNDLESAVSDLHEAINALENQLAPLLGPEYPSENCCDRKQGESEVAERIISRADFILDCSAQVRRLIDRL